MPSAQSDINPMLRAELLRAQGVSDRQRIAFYDADHPDSAEEEDDALPITRDIDDDPRDTAPILEHPGAVCLRGRGR